MKKTEFMLIIKSAKEMNKMNEISEDAVNELKTIAGNAGTDISLIDVNQCFAGLLWCDEDIKRALLNAGQPWDTDSIEKVKTHIDRNFFEDCSAGNEKLAEIVKECVSEHSIEWTPEFVLNVMENEYPKVRQCMRTAEQVIEWLGNLEPDYDFNGKNPVGIALKAMGYLREPDAEMTAFIASENLKEELELLCKCRKDDWLAFEDMGGKERVETLKLAIQALEKEAKITS